MSSFRDLTGQRFERLIVLERISNGKRNVARWICKCDCGKSCIVIGYHLSRGSTRSCGCLRREIGAKRLIQNNTTHGHTQGQRSRTYQTWISMRERCTDLSHRYYYRYGGLGISVCPRWLDSFENFLEDMGKRPEGCTLDRIDRNGSYEKSNCRWATRQQQQRNMRSNRMITYGNKTFCLAEWAERYRIYPRTLGSRLKAGWPMHRALTEPSLRKSSDRKNNHE